MIFFKQSIILLASFISVMPSLALGEDYPEILSAWRAAEARSASGEGGPQAMEEVAQKIRAWKKQQGPDFNWENEQQRASFELIEFAIAKAWTRAGNYNKALEYLEKEASAYQTAEGRFLENTRDPSLFAKDVFALHSEIMAHTGVTGSIPGSGYDVFATVSEGKSPAFVFVYGSDGEFQAEFATEGVEANEQKKMIYLFEPDAQGHYAVADRAQVIADRVRFTVSGRKSGTENYLVLDGIKKVIEYKPTSGYPDVTVSPLGQIELRVGAGKIEQPLAAIERVTLPQQDKGSSTTTIKSPTTNRLPIVQPPVPKKAPELKPTTTPSAEPTSSTPWSIIVVLIVAATGLLWLLVKNNRK